MTEDRDVDEVRLAELIAALRPAPEAWVRAAQELPRARREMDRLAERAEADAAFRETLLADLAGALREAAIEPTPHAIAQLRDRVLH